MSGGGRGCRASGKDGLEPGNALSQSGQTVTQLGVAQAGYAQLAQHTGLS